VENTELYRFCRKNPSGKTHKVEIEQDYYRKKEYAI